MNLRTEPAASAPSQPISSADPRGAARPGSLPNLGAELAPAWGEEESVLGAEDWDFVGQLNRHPHLARKDPALSSRASRIRAAPLDGLSPAGSGRPLPTRSARPRFWVSPNWRPPKAAPSSPDLDLWSPRPALEGLHDALRAAASRPPPGRRGAGGGTMPGWGMCGDLALPSSSTSGRAQELTRRETSPPSREAQLRAA